MTLRRPANPITLLHLAIAVGLILLAVTGRWLSAEFGLVSLAVGAVGLALALGMQRRTGARWPIIVVDLWFLFYGLVLGTSTFTSPSDGDVGPGAYPMQDMLGTLGGAQQLVGVLWVAASLASLYLVVRSRTRRSIDAAI